MFECSYEIEKMASIHGEELRRKAMRQKRKTSLPRSLTGLAIFLVTTAKKSFGSKR